MDTRKPFYFFASTSVALALVTLWLWHQLTAQHAELEGLRQRIGDLERSTAWRVGGVASVSSPATPRADAADELSAVSAPPARTTAQMLAERADIAQRNHQLDAERKAWSRLTLRDREVHAARVEAWKLGSMSRMADLSSLPNWNPQLVERLSELLAQQQVAGLENPGLILEDGQVDYDLTKPGIQSGEAQQRDFEAKFNALLGAERIAQWEEYQRTAGARNTAHELRNLLEGSSTPLADSQIPALVRALADQQQVEFAETAVRNPIASRGLRDESERIPMMEGFVEQAKRMVQQRHDAVAPYLSPAQLARYDQMNRLQLEKARNDLRLVRAQQELEKRGAAP